VRQLQTTAVPRPRRPQEGCRRQGPQHGRFSLAAPEQDTVGICPALAVMPGLLLSQNGCNQKGELRV
jgi:hypothetical protein